VLGLVHYFQIFNAIICYISVFVMYDFIRGKKSSKVSFHYQPVAIDVSATIRRIWMVRGINQDAPMPIINFATLPSAIPRTVPAL
jgi:hypothetical protein